ncbi:MAG: 2-phospho-L-lactate guanylyltransferase [Chloroflexi bacterium]|nr:2-phospho-L-lactate guanylyltransferase [Chloroflexota bacterium]
MASGLRVLVPMKGLEEAKSRLWADVPTPERQAAVLGMLDRVVRSAVGAVAACTVVGGDDAVRRVAEAAGAGWTPDPASGLNAALASAMRTAYADGAQAALFLPADLPLIERDDVLALAEASRGYARPVGVEAAADGGTNALLVPASCAFEPRLGEDSFAKHRAAAEAAGSPLVALDAPNIAFDVDTAADYAWAKANVDGFAAALDAWGAWLEGAPVPGGSATPSQ